jgi:hypothetical protein
MKNNDTAVMGCALLICSAIIGPWCFDYSLYSVFGKDIFWLGDFAGGMILGSLAVPVAILCWIARLCGVPVPFVG